jgi:hypothetical protein
VSFQLAADYILDHPDDFLPFLIAGEELPPGGLKKYCDEVTAATSNNLFCPAVPNRRWLMTKTPPPPINSPHSSSATASGADSSSCGRLPRA